MYISVSDTPLPILRCNPVRFSLMNAAPNKAFALGSVGLVSGGIPYCLAYLAIITFHVPAVNWYNPVALLNLALISVLKSDSIPAIVIATLGSIRSEEHTSELQ